MTTVYSKPNCVQCKATYAKLDNLEIPYKTIDITTDKEALDYVLSLGYQQAPVVTTNTEHWSGYRPDRIANIQKG